MAKNFSLDPTQIIRVTDTGTRAEIKDPGGRPDETEQDCVRFTANGTDRQISAEADNDDSDVTQVGIVFTGKGDEGVGSIPAASRTAGVTAIEDGDPARHRTRFTLTTVAITITDDGTAGAYGTLQLYTFPAGDILVERGRMTLTVATAGAPDTGLAAAAVLDIGVGESALAAAAEALSGDYENLINLDDITLSSGDLSAAVTILEATGDTITGNSTAGDPGEAHLNVACTAATCDASDTLTLTGEIDLLWYNYGDY